MEIQTSTLFVAFDMCQPANPEKLFTTREEAEAEKVRLVAQHAEWKKKYSWMQDTDFVVGPLEDLLLALVEWARHPERF
jgi:hypothetical protein